ncbi:MAG TPA: TonB-dependent receptor plug domain-containing protein [Ramlibacter sp.]|nr:TonB-dependent receptor plug domain-containing protein [Ramlibacter sp.]
MKSIPLALAPVAAALAAFAGSACAQTAASTLPAVTIQGNYDNAVGSSDAASQGVVNSRLLEARPTLRPAEVLEFVPGMIVTQHSGDGKANQYFLRGFNLDHGTDFATWVDGMPANMVSHAHGQGYTDLNWLIPELVDRIDYRKGPYYAEEGDFSSAGAAHIRLFDTLPERIAAVTAGQRGYGRALLAGSTGLASGNVLYSVEASHNDGPWRNPEKFHRFNAVLRYSIAEGPARWSLTGMAYSAGWNATDQIPQRTVDAGLIDRFGAVDPSDGGRTARYSLSWQGERRVADGEWRATAYAVRSRLALFSNFTYFLDHPSDDPANNADGIAGDQFSQAERRTFVGGSLSRRWNTPMGERDGSTTVGVQLRQDRLAPVGLYNTVARQRAATIQESQVREGSIGVHASNDTQWLPWLRAVAGVRADHFRFDVASSIPANSGKREASIASPKLSLIFGPWQRTELFLNAGSGFHSNDARGTVTQLTPRELLPTSPVTPLVRTKGGEVGLRTEIVQGLQSSLAAWQLRLGSELVFSGDAGDTEASRASRRSGIEWNNRYRAASWLLLDADLAWSRARFTQDDPAGNHIPGAVGKVLSLGATVTQVGPWSGQFQLRYFGPRPLIEDGSQRSRSTTLAYLRVGYRVTADTQLLLDVFNLFDRKASDVDYFYPSRLRGEPIGGVADRHFHPVEPRSVRLTLKTSF